MDDREEIAQNIVEKIFDKKLGNYSIVNSLGMPTDTFIDECYYFTCLDIADFILNRDKEVLKDFAKKLLSLHFHGSDLMADKCKEILME